MRSPLWPGWVGPMWMHLLPALKRAAPYLRGQVAHGLRLKFAPELTFQPDTALEYATKIDRLLHQPEVARDLEPPE